MQASIPTRAPETFSRARRAGMFFRPKGGIKNFVALSAATALLFTFPSCSWFFGRKVEDKAKAMENSLDSLYKTRGITLSKAALDNLAGTYFRYGLRSGDEALAISQIDLRLMEGGDTLRVKNILETIKQNLDRADTSEAQITEYYGNQVKNLEGKQGAYDPYTIGKEKKRLQNISRIRCEFFRVENGLKSRIRNDLLGK